MTNIETIADALAKLIDGEAAPSFQSDELPALLNSMQGLVFPFDHARLGSAVVELLASRCRSTMVAERELAELQHGSRSPS